MCVYIYNIMSINYIYNMYSMQYTSDIDAFFIQMSQMSFQDNFQQQVYEIEEWLTIAK